MLRICAVLVAGATALQAPRQPLSTAPSWLQAATLEQPPATTSKDLLPRERYVSPSARIKVSRRVSLIDVRTGGLQPLQDARRQGGSQVRGALGQ